MPATACGAFDYGRSDVTVQAAITDLYGIADLDDSTTEIAEYGGKDVGRVATMGATFHGTTLADADKILRPLINAFPHLAPFFASSGATEQVIDSKQVEQLNNQPDSFDGIVYTSVYSPIDKAATPNSTSLLKEEAGADVANINVLDTCGVELQHEEMPGSHTMAALMRWGLERDADDHTPKAADCGF